MIQSDQGSRKTVAFKTAALEAINRLKRPDQLFKCNAWPISVGASSNYLESSMLHHLLPSMSKTNLYRSCSSSDNFGSKPWKCSCILSHVPSSLLHCTGGPTMPVSRKCSFKKLLGYSISCTESPLFGSAISTERKPSFLCDRR